MKDKGLSYSEIGKIEGVSRQAVHELLTRKKHSVKKVLDSLYWEVVDEDDDYDGNLHITSKIDGSGIRININDILDALANKKIYNKKGE